MYIYYSNIYRLLFTVYLITAGESTAVPFFKLNMGRISFI